MQHFSLYIVLCIQYIRTNNHRTLFYFDFEIQQSKKKEQQQQRKPKQ